MSAKGGKPKKTAQGRKTKTTTETVTSHQFTDTEKIELANQVNKYPCIWDVSHKNYKRSDIQSNCWQLIANTMLFKGFLNNIKINK